MWILIWTTIDSVSPVYQQNTFRGIPLLESINKDEFRIDVLPRRWIVTAILTS